MKLLLKKIKVFFLNLFRQKKIKIRKSGTYEFGDNYKLIFKNDKEEWLNNCNITCGNNSSITCGHYCNITCGNNCEISCWYNCNINCGSDCEIKCWWYCNINCGNNCKIDCASECNIICGNDCEINCGFDCYIKADERSQLKPFGFLRKTITKGEEFIWWYVDKKFKLINTFEDVDWKDNNSDKWNEFYGFVHNELDSATLF